MVTTHHYWLWSLAGLFIIGIGPCDLSPSILRSNGAVGDPLAELKQTSCSQQLEKLKQETRRHISAVNAITDNAVTAAWRNRRLLSTVQPLELKAKALPTALVASQVSADPRIRIPAKLEETGRNSLGKYLSSLDHSGWVSKCLKGGRCAMTDPKKEASENQGSEESGSKGNTRNVTSGIMKTVTLKSTNEGNSTVDSIRETNKPACERHCTESNQMFNLLPSSYGTLNDHESEASRSEQEATPIEKNGTSLMLNEADQKSKVLNTIDDEPRIFSGTSNEQNVTRGIEYTKYTDTNRTITVLPKENTSFESGSFSSLIEEPPYKPVMGNSYLITKDQNYIPIDSFKYLPSTNNLVHYNNPFVPLTIHLNPMTYYQRYPRNQLSGREALTANEVVEKTVALNPKPVTVFDQSVQSLLVSKDSSGSGKNTSDVESLDSLVSTYGEDMFTRVSTGKRESEFSNTKKEAVSTNYPEVPSPASSRTYDGQIRTRVAPAEDGNDSSIYLFVGGNWEAHFKDNPQFFYIQPQSRKFTLPQPSTETTAGNNVDSPQLSQQQPFINPNCGSNRNLAAPYEFNLPPLYAQPSYAADEGTFAQKIPSPACRARTSAGNKIPSTVAARNGYAWYDYDSMTNDVNSTPKNGPSSGGPVAFLNNAGLNSIPRETRKGFFKSKIEDLNYEASLVNFPPQQYEPPVVGYHDISAWKPEDSMEHDINTSDMFVLGTQILATMPLTPSEHHADDSNDTAYGNLVADVSSRSSPSLHQDSAYTAFTNTAFKAHEMINSQRVRPPNHPEFQPPSTYFPSSWPNEFEFVSGQWVKREPVADMSAERYIYDQAERRRI